MKQVLKYPGAKSRIVNWIVNNMPKHTVYLEPYAGRNDLYNSILEGWRKIKKDTLAEAGVKREEVLWLNYADAQLSFEADFPEVMP